MRVEGCLAKPTADSYSKDSLSFFHCEQGAPLSTVRCHSTLGPDDVGRMNGDLSIEEVCGFKSLKNDCS